MCCAIKSVFLGLIGHHLKLTIQGRYHLKDKTYVVISDGLNLIFALQNNKYGTADGVSVQH